MWGFILKFKKMLVKSLEFVVVVAMGVLTLDVLWGVFSRYVLHKQSKWTEELAVILLVWVSLLGASVAFGAKVHLGVDYFISKLDLEAQKVNEIIVNLVIIAFAAAVMIFGGYVLVSATLLSGQDLPAMGFKKGYVYLAVPISGIFIVIFCLEAIAEILTGKPGNIDEGRKDLD